MIDFPQPASHLVDIVFPGDTNHHNSLFGGAALSHMDKVAFIAASRYGRRSFVTASCERIDFEAPAEQGQIVDFAARVVHAGKRSLAVEVEMHSENLLTGDKTHCSRGIFNMVSPDKEASPLPALLPVKNENQDDDQTKVSRVDLVFADQTNHYGTFFGGSALSMMGKTAFITATRYARKIFVMASSHQIDFLASAHEGEIIDLQGIVKSVGNTSLGVEVSMYAEDLLSEDRRLCAKSNFTMVAVNEHGRPVSCCQAAE